MITSENDSTSAIQGESGNRASTPHGAVTLLQIEPTTRCNFTCGFCYGRSMDQSDLDFSTFEKVYAMFPNLERLELHGEGEPMLSPHFFDMAKAASAKGVFVSAITNGSMFSSTRIEQLLDCGVQALFVSIESPRETEFKRIRGGSLTRVKRGIRAVLAARDARGQSHPSVGFSVTVLKSTQERLGEIAELYLELNMDGGISAHMLNTMPDYHQYYTQGMKEQTLTDTEQALVWLRYRRLVRDPAFVRARIHFSDIVFGQVDAADDEGGQAPSTPTAREYRSCPWLDDALYVNRHGSTSGCARIKNTQKYGFGNVKTESIETIVERRQRLSDQVCAGEGPPACQGCFIADSIHMRLSRLMDKRPRRLKSLVSEELWDSGTANAAGRIGYDSEAIRALLAFCDGVRSVRDIIHCIATQWRADVGATRRRLLPVVSELVRLHAIGSKEATREH